jgi:hypothetical protein
MKHTLYRIFQNTGLIVVSLGLLFGGIQLLQTGIPFWSLLYGLPAIGLGLILAILSFNEITKHPTLEANEYHQIVCKVCHRTTLVPLLVTEAVCPNCQYKMAVRLNMTVLFFFAVIALPLTLLATQQIQDIRQRAKGQQVQCEPGTWSPVECRCGSWNTQINCGEKQRARLCGEVLYCCTNDGNPNRNCSVR